MHTGLKMIEELIRLLCVKHNELMLCVKHNELI